MDGSLETSVVINATNIGRVIDGIGVYTLNLLRELAPQKPAQHTIIYFNRNCIEHLGSLRFAEGYEVRWVSGLMSPDNHFRGHFLRLLYSNYLALKHRKSVFVVTSQMEAVFVRGNTIMTIHDIIPLLFKQLHRKQYYYFRFLLGFAMNRAGKLITPSHHTRTMLEKYYRIASSKIEVIHNGGGNGEIGLAAQPRKTSENYILYAGRVVEIKNVDGVIQAFSRLTRFVPHKLVIAGKGRETSFAGDEHADRIVFMGHVSSEELGRLLKGASLFVFPSFYEGFGFPPLEAMACGCPVVVSGVSSLPEVCGDAAYYIDPCNVQSIVSGMYRVLTDEQLRKTLIAKGYARARSFTWQQSARKHMNLFSRFTRIATTHTRGGNRDVSSQKRTFGDVHPLVHGFLGLYLSLLLI